MLGFQALQALPEITDMKYMPVRDILTSHNITMWYCWPRLTVSICECYRGISPTLSPIPLLHCYTHRPMWTNGSLLQLVSLKWRLETSKSSFQPHPSEQVIWVCKESGMGQSRKGRAGGRWEGWLGGRGEVEEENCAGGACNNFCEDVW